LEALLESLPLLVLDMLDVVDGFIGGAEELVVVFETSLD